jgi:hypothetical protein
MPEIIVKIISQIDHSLWTQCKNYIRYHCKTDSLYDNYANLEPENYSYFNCALIDDRIVSFGAVEISEEKWGPEIARVLTRFWIHPDFRSSGLTKWGSQNIRFSPLILKPQLDFLQTSSKIKAAMITREGKYRNSFNEIIRLANTVSQNNFTVLPGKYNVCEPMHYVPEGCRQMIALCPLKGNSIDCVFEIARSKQKFKLV